MRRFQGRGVDREDLFQQGVEGLIKAKRTYDPLKGTRFSTWAVPMILGHMRRACEQAPPMHIPRTDREKWRQIQSARAALLRRLGREPTSGELCGALRLPASEFVQLMSIGQLSCLPIDQEQSGASLPSFEDHLLLEETIGHLPQPMPKLLYLRYHNRLTQRQAAKVLGLSQSFVSKLEKKAARQLREMLFPVEVDAPPML